MITFRNLYAGIKDQLPVSRLFQSIRTGNVFGLFHIRSHQRVDGLPKIAYNTKATAVKSATAMAKKNGVYFSNYKCIFCDGYHIGKKRSSVPITKT